MRIAIYHNLPSGGAKRSLFEAARRLSERHSVDVYTLSSSNLDFADLRPIVKNYHVFPVRLLPMLRSPFGRLNPLLRIENLRRVERAANQAAEQIDSVGYDVVLVHPCQFENSPSILRYVKRVPSVYYCHEPLRIIYEKMPWRPYDREEAARRKLLNRYDPLPEMFRRRLRSRDRANIRQARRVLVNSQFTRLAVRDIYEVEARVSYHGVDAGLFRPLGLERERFVFSVGSLTPLKGFDFLIEAVALIPPAERPRLVIVSNFQNPPERDYLNDLAKTRGVDLDLLDKISDGRLVELYNRAGLTAYAPHREPFGFISLEAMACETPLAVVDEGGIPEAVIPGKTALAAPREPRAFADVICTLLADRSRAVEIGKAGRRHVLDHWTWEHAVQSLEQNLIF